MAGTAQQWTLTSLAVELNFNRDKLGRKLAGLDPIKTDGQKRYYLMSDVFLHLMKDTGQGKEKVSMMEADRRYRLAKAEISEMDLETKKGQLVEVAQVEKMTTNVVGQMRTRLLALPTRLAGRISSVTSAPKCREIIKDGIYEALNELTRIEPSKKPPAVKKKKKKKKKTSKKKASKNVKSDVTKGKDKNGEKKSAAPQQAKVVAGEAAAEGKKV